MAKSFLAQFTDMRAPKKVRDMLLAFKEDIGTALSKTCELDRVNEAIHLARAAKKILCRHLFEKTEPFKGFPVGCQKESVPSILLALVNMILEGSSIHDNSEASTSAALSIALLLKFSSMKHKHKHATLTIRHSIDQEIPVPIYIGLRLHAHSRKRDLIDRHYSLGMSISYDWVLRLKAQIGSSVCEKFHREHVVCPPKLRYQVSILFSSC